MPIIDYRLSIAKIHCVHKKTPPFYFSNNSVKN